MEAIADEVRTLEPDGVIALPHLEPLHTTLAPAISAALERLGLTTLERAARPFCRRRPDSTDHPPVAGLAASRNPKQVDAFRALRLDAHDPPRVTHSRTDYADLLTYLHVGF